MTSLANKRKICVIAMSSRKKEAWQYSLSTLTCTQFLKSLVSSLKNTVHKNFSDFYNIKSKYLNTEMWSTIFILLLVVCMYVCIEVALRGDAHGIGRSNWA